MIVGLGNPGLKYADTRHNVGFDVIDQLSCDLNIRFDTPRFQSIAALGKSSGKDIILIRPLTFMNLSGEAVVQWMRFYDIGPESMLVVHDDLDLPLGKIKAVKGGGAGGHRGVRSIIDSLNSMDFPRIKIGIGRPRHGEDIEDFVLAPFYDDEKELIKQVLQAGMESCRLFISKGIESVMNKINRQDIENEETKKLTRETIG
jgi:PTH1 family peptidyl-tRNA hydrolase